MNVDRAFHQVRTELAEVGLLAEGVYLDQIDLCVSHEPSLGEQGYVFEVVGHYGKLGFKPGVIYVPKDAAFVPNLPGMTLIDIIRHEFAHAWRTLDPRFFREEWFARTFGTTYGSSAPKPHRVWKRSLTNSRRYRADLKRCRTEAGRKRVLNYYYRQQFITEYASKCACEDFAETFMFYLKYRNSLERFDSRPIVSRKLRAVERAVARAARRIADSSQDDYRVRSA